MIGGILHIFFKYGNQIAKKYGYENCQLCMNTDKTGGLMGFTEDDPLESSFLTWVDLKDAYYLMHVELREILESGGRK